MDRRHFLRTVAGGTCLLTLTDAAGALLPLGAGSPPAAPGPDAARAEETKPGHEAWFYQRLADKEIECVLCPRRCRVGDRERGYCGARKNEDGVYYTLTYGRPCALHVDPIEKKPLFHVLPRSQAFSLAVAGCNMNCKFCQNWEISQSWPEQVRSVSLSPADCAERARREGARSIAYTYTEPVIFLEYMHDIAVEARKRGLKNVMISAGFVEEAPLRKVLPHLDAVKIDLKSYSDDYYREICQGRLEPVLRSLKTVRDAGTWLEIVYLVLPTLNDDPGEVEKLSRWIVAELGPDVPIHFSRFTPRYRMKRLPPTPVGTLERLHGAARAAGLHYVYLGNVPGHPAESTYCPGCEARLIHRSGFSTVVERMADGACAACGRKIPGVWHAEQA